MQRVYYQEKTLLYYLTFFIFSIGKTHLTPVQAKPRWSEPTKNELSDTEYLIQDGNVLINQWRFIVIETNLLFFERK